MESNGTVKITFIEKEKKEMSWNNGNVEQTQQSGEKKEFVATVSPATNNSGVCAFQNLSDK